jgi:hypothetical protein
MSTWQNLTAMNIFGISSRHLYRMQLKEDASVVDDASQIALWDSFMGLEDNRLRTL